MRRAHVQVPTEDGRDRIDGTMITDGARSYFIPDVDDPRLEFSAVWMLFEPSPDGPSQVLGEGRPQKWVKEFYAELARVLANGKCAVEGPWGLCDDEIGHPGPHRKIVEYAIAHGGDQGNRKV